jgi:hypothetical protein
VNAHVRVRKQNREDDEYRICFELNRQHCLVSYDTKVFVPAAGTGEPSRRYSPRRDLIVAIQDPFLKTQLNSTHTWLTKASSGLRFAQGPRSSLRCDGRIKTSLCSSACSTGSPGRSSRPMRNTPWEYPDYDPFQPAVTGVQARAEERP